MRFREACGKLFMGGGGEEERAEEWEEKEEEKEEEREEQDQSENDRIASTNFKHLKGPNPREKMSPHALS